MKVSGTTPILYIQGSAERAGAETMLLNLLRHLDRERFAPTVAFFAGGPFRDEVESLGVEVRALEGSARLRNPIGWRDHIRSIRGAIRASQAALVHANGEKMSIFTARAARAEGVASIAWLHDAPGSGGLAGVGAQLAMAVMRCDAVVTCSAWMAAAFNRTFGIHAQAIINGLDLARLPDPGTAIDEIKELRGWPADSIIVTHAARLQRWKGTEVFLEAAARLKEPSQLRFLVVGGALYGREKSYAEGLRARADGMGLGERLAFTGYRPDALRLIAGSHIVVHCSLRSDPFPTVVLEGMALGKPVVATRTRGPEEAITDTATGFLVPPGDPGAIASVVEALARSPELRSRVGDAARVSAHERYSAARMADEFGALYLRLAS